MTAVNFSTAFSATGTPEVDVYEGFPGLRVWPAGRDKGPLLTMSIADWYTLVAAVNAKVEKVAP